jgi:hypothetical protein
LKVRGLSALAALAACGFSAPAWAQDDGTCRNGLFGDQNSEFGAAHVIGSGRLHFLEDMDGCPNATAACRQRAFVVPGDRLVTGRSKQGYVCAYFPNRGGGTAGWVEKSRLRIDAINPRPPLTAWRGTWADGDNHISFSIRRGALVVDGEAFWPSANPSLKDRPGGPNLGNVGGPLEVAGNSAREPECDVHFVLLGDVVVASDQSRQCDGANVSFSGVYTRSRR